MAKDRPEGELPVSFIMRYAIFCVWFWPVSWVLAALACVALMIAGQYRAAFAVPVLYVSFGVFFCGCGFLETRKELAYQQPDSRTMIEAVPMIAQFPIVGGLLYWMMGA